MKKATLPKSNTIELLPMDEYDHIIVAFSGGKDSMACFLHLLDLEVSREKIELWHHDIDGREGSNLFDWPVTRAYCKSVAKEFGVPIYFSWKEGGFEKEMKRNGDPTSVIKFEEPQEGGGVLIKMAGGKGKPGTRMKFPQISPDLSVRWCSAYLKIDVCSAAFNNQDRFRGKKTLFITGERGEESAARSKYRQKEEHKTDLRNGKKYTRRIDHWRPIRDWSEFQVWDLIEKYKVRAHPSYFLGFGRCSCQFCIFGNANQFATAAAASPDRFETLKSIEKEFGVTMKRKETLEELVKKGILYDSYSEETASKAVSEEYEENIIMDKWILPSGAFGESCGPL